MRKYRNRTGVAPGHRMFDNYVKHFTTLRQGVLGDQDDRNRTEMFIDPIPYFSLAGFGLNHDKSPRERSNMVAKNPRAHTDYKDLGTAALHRSCGKKTGAAQNKEIGPIHQRGAPPKWPSMNRWRDPLKDGEG